MIANGKMVDMVVGAYPKEPLRARISKVFSLA
jgi:thioredoxin-like negative regulator of GroEL